MFHRNIVSVALVSLRKYEKIPAPHVLIAEVFLILPKFVPPSLTVSHVHVCPVNKLYTKH